MKVKFPGNALKSLNPGSEPSDGQSRDKSRGAILFLISQSDIVASEIFESRKSRKIFEF